MNTAPNRTNDARAVGQQLSFLPEPEFKPSVPDRDTLEWRALAEMLEGKSIEQPDWLKATRSWRLAATIKKLDYLGWRPNSVPVHRDGHKRPIARYSLPQTAIRIGAAMLAETQR